MTHLLLVALGGAIGSLARYLTGLAALRLLGAGFPFGTLAVNVFGSFLMGVVAAWLTMRQPAWTGVARAFLATGALGGFTTFSAFSLDAVLLWERGAHALAVLYVAASVALSIAALLAGLALARSLA